MPNVVTVREAVQRARQDGFPISEYTLRQWIKTGDVPVRKAGSSGKKFLIYYPNLLSYLRCENSADNAPATVLGGIRRVEV